jgi:hypothetical protein
MTQGDAGCNIMRSMLIILLGLHLYWFYLLVRIATRLTTANAHAIARDEYEGSSSDSTLEADREKEE